MNSYKDTRDNDFIASYYSMDIEDIPKVKDFCETYVNAHNTIIFTLYRFDELVLKIDNDILRLINEGVIKKRKMTFKTLIFEHQTKDTIAENIPNIKEVFAQNGLHYTKSMRSGELKKIIYENKDIFYKYFKNFIKIELSARVYDMIAENYQYIKDYLENCIMYDKLYNFGNKIKTVAPETLERYAGRVETPKDKEKLKQDIKQRIEDLKAKENKKKTEKETSADSNTNVAKNFILTWVGVLLLIFLILLIIG